MGPQNFPQGVASFGVPVYPGAGMMLPLTTGRFYFVNSNGGTAGVSAGGAHEGGRSPERPFATIGAAITAARAAKGDVILVGPGHSETITGAGGITVSKSGLTIVGMGEGSLRPRFLMDGAATVTCLITAAGVTMRNMIFAAGHADIVTGIGVSAADVWLDQLEFVNHVVDENFLTEIKALGTTDNEADGLKVTRCRAITVDASGAEFIELNADINRMVVADNYVCKDAATAGKFILQATGKDLQGVIVTRNTLITGMTAGDLLIDNDTTANWGVVSHNFIGHHDVAGAVPIDADGVRMFENYAAFEDATQGTLQPVAGTLA